MASSTNSKEPKGSSIDEITFKAYKCEGVQHFDYIFSNKCLSVYLPIILFVWIICHLEKIFSTLGAR